MVPFNLKWKNPNSEFLSVGVVKEPPYNERYVRCREGSENKRGGKLIFSCYRLKAALRLFQGEYFVAPGTDSKYFGKGSKPTASKIQYFHSDNIYSVLHFS